MAGCVLAQNASSLGYEFHKTVVIKNASIYLDYKTKLDSATLIIDQGKIVGVGKNIIIPPFSEVLDYSGKIIYPSFIDVFTDYGIGEVRSPAGGKPQYETTVKGAYNINQAIKPEIEADKYFKHDAAKAKQLRDLGFGVVATANKDGIIRGTSCTVLLADKAEQELILEAKSGLNLSFSKGSSTQEYPSSLMGSIALLRQTMYDANWYGQKIGERPYDISLEALNQHKSKPWIFDAGNINNALRAKKIADEFGAKALLHASGDEYQRLNELTNADLDLIVSINFPEAYKISSPLEAELLSNTQLMEWYFAPFNIQYLINKKINFSITTHHLKDIKDFNKNLRRVLETDVDESLILKSLTHTPAMQLNLAQTTGSLHVGKLANFLVVNTTLSHKDFKIYENWVKGEKYEINPISKDFNGTYNLSIKGFKDFKLELSSSQDKVTAVLSKDTTKLPAVAEVKQGDLLLTLNLSKLDSSFKNKVYLKVQEFNGNTLKGVASCIAWGANMSFEAKRNIFATGIGKKDSLDQVLKKRPGFELPIPFNAFGRDAIPLPQNYVINNATLWTGEDIFELRDHQVLIKEGKIVAIGSNLNLGKYFSGRKYTEIDATHKYVTAGIIDEHSHIALTGGVNETGQSVTSEVRIQDVINPTDVNIYRQLSGGVTTSHLLHGSANCIGGQSALIDLKWGQSAEGLLFAGNKPFIKFALGENVKQSNWGDRYVIRYPQTRMGVEQTIVDAFQRAKEYKELKQLSMASNWAHKRPKYDLELEAIEEILDQKRFITCHSYSQSEINMLMKVAEKYNIKVNTFTHVLEGYKLADKLKMHGAGASSFSDWWSFKAEVKDAIPQNASILSRKGVVTAINSDDAEMGRRLNQEAAKSVKYGGLSQEAAWKLITLNPAKLLHIDEKVGSLKVGKNANIVIWSTNPLSIYSKVEKVFIEGTIYFDEMENESLMVLNRTIRNRIVEDLLNDKTPEDKKQSPKMYKQEYYHCDSFETND